MPVGKRSICRWAVPLLRRLRCRAIDVAVLQRWGLTAMLVLAVSATGCDLHSGAAPEGSTNDPSAAPVASNDEPADSPEDAAQFDWPNWGGPQHNHVSRESGWRMDWENRPPKKLWQRNVGTGFSSVSVVGDRLYTMGNQAADGRRQEHVYCLNTDTGDVLWEHTYPGELVDNLHVGGPGSTPTVDQGRVFTLGREGQLFCFNATTGDVVWQKELSEDLGVPTPEWGFTCSPLVVGEKLIIQAGRTVAYNKATGEKIWQTKLYRPGYGSAVHFEHGGRQFIAVLHNDGLLVVSADDGGEVDIYPWDTSYVTTATTPIVSGDSIFISSGYNKGCALVNLSDGELQYEYENRLMRNHFNNSVLYEGNLYGMDGNSHSARNVKLVSMDFATGRVHWRERGFGAGSVTIADGKLIVLSDDGELVIAPATPDAFKPLARFRALEGQCWTVPVLARGRIYCRSSAGELVCLDVGRQ